MRGTFGDVAAARWDAGRYVTVMAVCFGLTVVLTRLYLISAGYPKIGGATYHIAHSLFGGLSLVIACVLMLLYANRGVVMAAAVLSGLGLGLFIDEVGKFITANNDYFFPLAAPIIYFTFLLVVLVARRAHRVRARGPRALLIEALDGLPALLSGRMTVSQREVLLARLEAVRTAGGREDHCDLAQALQDYLRVYAPLDGMVAYAGARPSALVAALLRVEDRLAPQRVLRPLLTAVVAAHALWSTTRLAMTAAVAGGWHTQFGPLARLLDTSGVHGWKGLLTWGCSVTLEVVVAILYTAAAIEWLCGRERTGVRAAEAATVLTLTAVNVLNSYFNQFATVFTALAEGLLLVALLRYRRRFLAGSVVPSGRVESQRGQGPNISDVEESDRSANR